MQQSQYNSFNSQRHITYDDFSDYFPEDFSDYSEVETASNTLPTNTSSNLTHTTRFTPTSGGSGRCEQEQNTQLNQRFADTCSCAAATTTTHYSDAARAKSAELMKAFDMYSSDYPESAELLKAFLRYSSDYTQTGTASNTLPTMQENIAAADNTNSDLVCTTRFTSTSGRSGRCDQEQSTHLNQRFADTCTCTATTTTTPSATQRTNHSVPTYANKTSLPQDVRAKIEPIRFYDFSECLLPISNEKLFEAAKNNQGQLIHQMLSGRNAPDINATDTNGSTALHIAAINRSLNALNALLEEYPNIAIDVNKTDNQDLTPLYYAVENAQEQAVQILLQHNAYTNVYAANKGRSDIDGKTPLHIAARNGDMAIVRLLLNNANNPAPINARDYCGVTPLFEAVSTNQTDIVKELLRRNAYCNYYVNRSRGFWTRVQEFGIHTANGLGPCCFSRIVGVAKHDTANYGDHFFAYTAVRRMDVSQPLHRGENALHRACSLGNIDIVQELIDKGAYIDAKDDNGYTPLLIAAQRGFEEIAQLLLGHKADVNYILVPLQIYHHTIIEQITPLTEACKNGHIGMVKVLLTWRANVHFDHDNALRIALSNGRNDIAFLLVNNGACLPIHNENVSRLPVRTFADSESLQNAFVKNCHDEPKRQFDLVSGKLTLHEQLREAQSRQCSAVAKPAPDSIKNGFVAATATSKSTATSHSTSTSASTTRPRSGSWQFEQPVEPSKLEFPKKSVEVIIYSDDTTLEAKLFQYLQNPCICQKLSEALNVDYVFKGTGKCYIPMVHCVRSDEELTDFIAQAVGHFTTDSHIEFIIFAVGKKATSVLKNTAIPNHTHINSVILFNPTLPSDDYAHMYESVANRVYNFWSNEGFGSRRKILSAQNNTEPVAARSGKRYFKGVNIFTQTVNNAGNTIENFDFAGINLDQFLKIIETITASHQYCLQTDLCSIIDNTTDFLTSSSIPKPLLKVNQEHLPIVFINQQFNFIKEGGEVGAIQNGEHESNQKIQCILPPELEPVVQLETQWSDSIKQDWSIDTGTTKLFRLIEENPFSREKLGNQAIDHVQTEIRTYRLEQEYLSKRKEQVVLPALNALCGPKHVVNRPINVAIVASGGGSRALFATYGTLKALQEIGVLGTVSYINSLSGSTWAVNSIYTQVNKHGKDVNDAINHAINNSLEHAREFSFLNAAIVDPIVRSGFHKAGLCEPTSIKVKKQLGQPVTCTDYYGYAIGRYLMGKEEQVMHDNYVPDHLSEQLGAQASWKEKDMNLPADYPAHLPFPIYTAIVPKNDTNKLKYTWLEFTPYQIGTVIGTGDDSAGMFVKTWAFGRKFKNGISIDHAPEQALEFYLGVFGSAMNSTAEDAANMACKGAGERIPTCIQHKFIAKADVFNPMYGMQDPRFEEYSKRETIGLADAGNAFNLPFPPLDDCAGKRPERKPDVIIFIDASADIVPSNIQEHGIQAYPNGDALNAVKEYAHLHNIAFPDINTVSIGNQPCSAFNWYRPELDKPTVIYLPLVKDPSKLRDGTLHEHIIDQYRFTGIQPQLPLSDIDLKVYSTRRTALTKQQGVDLMAIMHSNVFNNRENILEVIRQRTLAMQP